MAALDMLLNAQPNTWSAAAKDWRSLGGEAERSANAVYQYGTKEIEDAWKDPVGKKAAAFFEGLAERFRTTAASSHGVALVLEGLGESVETLQGRLRTAVNEANQAGATVNPDGSVRIPPNTPADRYAAAVKAGQQIQAVLAEADKIDTRASKELGDLTGSVGTTNYSDAVNNKQNPAAVSKMDMVRESLPDSKDPAENLKWWNSLTDQQREELKRAVPVQLYDMPGIPQQVRDQLAGSGTFNRVEAVRWAEQNWNNTGVDMFNDNCAHFVSTALENSGLAQKEVPAGGTVADSWERGTQTGWNLLDRQFANGQEGWPGSYTPSWFNAEAQYKFMSANGGTEISYQDARPGDLIYFQNLSDWRVHHVSMVTSVTPDGDIHYTQHNSEQVNASLNGRLAHTEWGYGGQIVHVIRLNPNW